MAEDGVSIQSSASPLPAGLSRDAAPFAFLAQAKSHGIDGALVTICGIDGGAPKPLGTHLAVLEDGRHVGHVSGGCVEPAIAAEIAPLIASGRDQIVRFGKESRFMDIRFPCGGGVDLLVHTTPSRVLLDDALAHFAGRRAFSIRFDVESSGAWIASDAASASGWEGAQFVRRYLPRTRLLAAGRGPELEVLARTAAAAELDLVLATPDEATASALVDLQRPIMLKSTRAAFAAPIDAWTATVLLFHEHEWEDSILAHAVGAAGFYVGALGSVRTHRARRARLMAMGLSAGQIERIHGPIGLIAHARDPGTLALSILAEISATRSQLDWD